MSDFVFRRGGDDLRRARDAVALEVSDGLGAATIATWDERVPRIPRVLVPVHLDALVVRQLGGTWADCRMQKPSEADLGAPLLPEPFAGRSQREPGVYLHWAIADAQTRGERSPTPDGTAVEPETPTVFPPIPDRWLVARLAPASDPRRRAVSAWVLESDLGEPVVTDLGAWREPGPREGARKDEALTALGWGDPAWAAYYDNVENRLGFFDALQGVGSGPLAYLVCGWYADPTQDPLGDPTITSLVAFVQRMKALAWQLPPRELAASRRHVKRYVRKARAAGLRTRAGEAEPVDDESLADAIAEEVADDLGGTRSPYTSDGSWWPKLTLFHGSAVGIGWPAHDTTISSSESGGSPQLSELKVAVGQTLPEALAELVARTTGDPDFARVVEGFQLGILRELGEPDGRARLDRLLHLNSFVALPGGAVTERIWEPPPPAAPTLPQDAARPTPGVFAGRVATPTMVGVRPGDFVVRTAREGTVRAEVHAMLTDEVPQGRIGDVRAGTGTEASNLVTPALFEEASARRVEGVYREPRAPAGGEPPPQGRWVDVLRALPRFWLPVDPVVLIQGGLRTFKHGGDGRFTDTGALVCRLSGFYVTELTALRADSPSTRLSVRAEQLLERGLDHGGIPVECDELLRELVYLDPGSARAAARQTLAVPAVQPSAADTALVDAQARNFAVEQTAWWALRDPRIDAAPIVAKSGMSGMLPSPVAVTPPSKPWNPRHLDWELEYFHSPNGTADWELDEIDFEPKRLPPDLTPGTGTTLTGRTLLTAGAAQTLADAARAALSEVSVSGASLQFLREELVRYTSGPAEMLVRFAGELEGDDWSDADGRSRPVDADVGDATAGDDGPIVVDERDALQDIVGALENMDVLGGALDGFHAKLRQDPWGARAVAEDGEEALEEQPEEGELPEGFVPLRAGVVRLLRLRLVDGYGQVLDLLPAAAAPGPGEGEPRAPEEVEETPTVEAEAERAPLFVAETMRIDDRPELVALTPGFTAPARLGFRFVSAEAGDSREATETITPVCGYVLTDHLDGALEFFSADGQGAGQIRPDSEAGLIWEDTPGAPSIVGQRPSRVIANAELASVAEGLLDWGVADREAEAGETALAALLRVIDTTRWTVDPFGRIGDEHHALLVGHPIAVMRARIRLEVDDPRQPAENALALVPIRLGSLAHWEDGLLGYFIGSDYRRLYCVDAAAAGLARALGPGTGFLQQINQVQQYGDSFATQGAAEAVNHPYVDVSGVGTIRPNQDVDLTLLVEPHGFVHATTGVVPRKEIGMRREWVAAALAKIAPTFRFGPVLVDPATIRMPIPTELPGEWTWDHRVEVAVWQNDPVVAATTDPLLPVVPAVAQEGWLRLEPPNAEQQETTPQE